MGHFRHPPSPKNRRERGKIVNPLFKFSFANLVYPRATVGLCEGRGGVGTVSPVRGLGLLVLGYECGGYAARGLRLLLTRRFIRFPGLCFWETAMKACGRVAGPSLPLGDAARSLIESVAIGAWNPSPLDWEAAARGLRECGGDRPKRFRRGGLGNNIARNEEHRIVDGGKFSFALGV